MAKMIEIPRIKRRIDLVDALCCISEDAMTFDLLDNEAINNLHKVIENARKHMKKKIQNKVIKMPKLIVIINDNQMHEYVGETFGSIKSGQSKAIKMKREQELIECNYQINNTENGNIIEYGEIDENDNIFNVN